MLLLPLILEKRVRSSKEDINFFLIWNSIIGVINLIGCLKYAIEEWELLGNYKHGDVLLCSQISIMNVWLFIREKRLFDGNGYLKYNKL